LAAAAQHNGRVVLATDDLIAATALHHGLKVMTRIVDEFAPTGAEVLNPWATSGVHVSGPCENPCSVVWLPIGRGHQWSLGCLDFVSCSRMSWCMKQDAIQIYNLFRPQSVLLVA